MALSLNKPKLDNLASDIWKTAERLRGKFRAYEYRANTPHKRARIEQRATVQGQKQSPTEVKGIAACIESQITTLTAYRKSLIHECVTGQRRITKAELSRVQNHAGT